MRGSFFGKWVIGHRFQAHLVVPGLFSLVLIGLYFFGNLLLQSVVAPGIWGLPGGRAVSLPGILKAFFLLWLLVLAVNTIRVSRDLEIIVAALAVGIATVLTFLFWMDGSPITSHVQSIWENPENTGEFISAFLADRRYFVGVSLAGLFSIVFFVLIPLFYSGSRNPVRAMLVANRWMILTVILMFAVFRFAYSLQDQGWGAVRGVEGALGIDVSVFVMLIFYYSILLYMAELNYLAWVRTQAAIEAVNRY